jgi:VWFA-related protein
MALLQSNVRTRPESAEPASALLEDMKRLAILFALLALPIAAQEPPKFGENVEVNAVLIDAVVTDPSGHQILGLDKNDFVVKENGVEQQIDSVDYFTNRKLLDSTEANAPFKVERVREERYFIFFFDKPSDTQLFDELTLARRSVRDFVMNQMREGDRVAVVGHDVRLKVYSDFTQDKKQLARALDEAGTFSLGTRTGSGPILNAIDRKKMMDRSGTVYEALTVLADAVRGIKARKNLVLFSAGILSMDQSVSSGGVVLSESRYYKPMIQALNAANVTVYAINLQRDAAEVPAFHQTLDRIASETNGEYFRRPVTFGPVIKKIEQETNGYYLITYTAHHPKGAKGYQHVEVSVKNRDLRVRAREGYNFGE